MRRLPPNGPILLILILLSVTLTGCVQRRLLIRSDPDGALVTVDDQAIGHTPYSLPYVYYGTRKIRLEKDGFETTEVKERVKPPWYQLPGINFFVDNFSFREIRDVRTVDVKLVPKSQTNENQLIQRGQELRQDVHRNTLIKPGG